MNKYQEFFSDKTIEFAEELYKYADEELKNIFKLQKLNRDTILRKVGDITLKYNVNEKACLNLSNSEFKTLYKELKVTVAEMFKNEYTTEESTLTELLTLVGNEKYLSNSYLLSLGKDFDIKKMDKSIMDKVLNSSVLDKNFSERIWDNKTDKVAKTLQNELKNFLDGKISINDVENTVKHRFNVDASHSKRLVETEVSRAMEASNLQWQLDHNIEWVMYMGTLDYHICGECGQYDGKPYKMNEKPVDLPQHPNCRCTYVAIPDKDYRPDKRIDNKTKEDINWKDYQQWKKENVDNNPEALKEIKMIKNKAADKKQHSKYKEILGKDIPKSFDDFQNLKYNDIKNWEELKEYHKYKIENPKANKTHFEMKRELEQLGIKGKIRVPAAEIDLNNIGFDNYHVNDERNHDTTKEEAIEFIRNAKVSISKWNGMYENYYGVDGAVYVKTDENMIRTCYKKNEFEGDPEKIREVILKYEKGDVSNIK